MDRLPVASGAFEPKETFSAHVDLSATPACGSGNGDRPMGMGTDSDRDSWFTTPLMSRETMRGVRHLLLEETVFAAAEGGIRQVIPRIS